ncbi:MAG: leucine--tRNA ligase [Bdellovibrionales bacterium]|nr:leucine--tRNA ligase [Bdellovibrionales bacterium]
MYPYDFQKLESKWQKAWDDQQTFKVGSIKEGTLDPSKPKYYVLDMFPYPSGKGLHVGHPLGYIATDIVARYKRMCGFNVLHPMGFDAFGLPAEQFAIETGTHPAITTDQNIDNMRNQLRACGLSYDWSREIKTTDPSYYKWTQWIFIKLYNSWFDEIDQKAKPIEKLIQSYENDEYRIDPKGNRIAKSDVGFQHAKKWKTFSSQEQEAILSKDRLAFLDDVTVNWCPGLGTVLANEEVTADGRSERGNYPVFKKPLKQWMLRITKYADRLEKDLKDVDWPEAVKQMQTNWIGKSEGAIVQFSLERNKEEKVSVFTTRPDTLFGCTFMVLAPEHPLVDHLVTDEQRQAVFAFREKMAAKSDVERQSDQKAKEGVFTGSYAVHPTMPDRRVPIWIADYVLMGYGFGAVMAVPAHDQRDFDFAKKHLLKIRAVVEPHPKFLKEHALSLMEYLEDPGALDVAYEGEGVSAQSDNLEIDFNGVTTNRAKEKMIEYLEKKEIGQKKIQYKLRDWLFSRQRYWGEPFPVLHGSGGSIQVVQEKDLPVILPEMEDFKPTALNDENASPQPSLGRAKEDWKEVTIDGNSYIRELNTMPQWAGSCWYYLRFTDPTNKNTFADEKEENYWMGNNGVDLYVGGVEHAVLHLLYARFWHKVLFDLGFVSTNEPFGKLFNQGYIQAYSYQDDRGMYVPAFDVQEEEDGTFTYEGQKVTRQLGKMGKSLKNSISPDEVIDMFGCDTFRLFEMYLGPIEQSKTWDTEAIVGVHRFLQRAWRNFVDEESGELLIVDTKMDDKLSLIVNKTIAMATKDMNEMKFNTAIAHLIQLNNLFVSMDKIPLEAARAFVLMLNPLAPHMAEELWQKLGYKESIAYASWPKADQNILSQDKVQVVVQINGKRRANLEVDGSATQEDIELLAKQDENVKKHLEGVTVVKTIYVPKKLVNYVVKP